MTLIPMVLVPVNHKIIAVHFFCHVYNEPMEIFIPCIPKAKGRPRFTRKGHAYTPQTTRTAEQEIAAHVRSVVEGAPLEGALRVDVEALMPIPKSLKGVKRDQAITCQIWPTTRFDADNLAKLCLDALNGILWHDDAQIVQLNITKRYAEQTGYRLIISRPVYSRVIPLARHS